MSLVIVVIALVSLIALAVGVADTVRSSSRQGGLPAASFTYRAYGA